jgi:hypothetical protein
MSRRRQEEEHFGSDSFLDVLANIVGILIILIVSAAARVERSVELAQTETAEESPIESPAEPTPVEPEAASAVAAVEEPVAESAEPPPEVVAELQAIQRKLAAAHAKSEAIAGKLKQFHSESASISDELSKQDAATAEQLGELKKRQVQLARMEEAFGERQGTLRGLLAEFEETAQSRPPTKELKHRLAPVSQEVTGHEVFFRMAGGKVSVVPVEMLFERVKNQVERHKDWIAARDHFEGVAGPIEGYALQFEVQKRTPTALDRNRLGFGAFRLGLPRADVILDRDIAEETPEQALKRGSRFALAIKSAPPRAALTFWVYPDSFHEYRMLQAACQAEGFIVAARPLGHGVKISFSEDGSRSAAQ